MSDAGTTAVPDLSDLKVVSPPKSAPSIPSVAPTPNASAVLTAPSAPDLSDLKVVAPPKAAQATPPVDVSDLKVVAPPTGLKIVGSPPRTEHPYTLGSFDQIPPYTLSPEDAKAYFTPVVKGLTVGLADMLETLDMPANYLVGRDDSQGSPAAVAKWLKNVVSEPQAKTTTGKIAQAGGEILGELPSGIAEWSMGVPFALLHGVKTARDIAASEGREPTFWEGMRDTLTEGGARGLLGWMTGLPWGRITTATAFGGTTGATHIIEHGVKSFGQAETYVDAGVSFVIGMLGPNITPGIQKKIDRIRAMADAGKTPGAMSHLNDLLRDNADVLTRAARERTMAPVVEGDEGRSPPPGPTTGRAPPSDGSLPPAGPRLPPPGPSPAAPAAPTAPSEGGVIPDSAGVPLMPGETRTASGDIETARPASVPTAQPSAEAHPVLAIESKAAETAGARAAAPTPTYEPVPRAPTRLLTWLVQNGGLRDDGGDVSQIIGVARARPGLINNRTGMSLDDAALRAWEQGYLPSLERPEILTLLDAIDHDARGHARYSSHDATAAAKFEDVMARNAEVDRLGHIYGLDPRSMPRQEFWDRVSENLSLDHAAALAGEMAESADREFADAEARARAWFESRGDAWEPESLYETGHPRSLADLEAQYRQEEAARPPQPSAGGAAAPGTSGGHQGRLQAGVRPGGRSVGSAGRAGEEATGRAIEGSPPPPPIKPPSTDVEQGPIPWWGNHHRLAVVSDRRLALERSASTLATAIAQRERANAILRQYSDEGELLFKGVSDDDRIAMMTAWMHGDQIGVPDEQRAFFDKAADIARTQALGEHSAGMEYEIRENYWPLQWKQEESAQKYANTTSRGEGKPGFTRGKVFNDPEEGRAQGFELKTTNPAVLWASRIEAGNAALTRIYAIEDFVKDGTAIPETEVNEMNKAYEARTGRRATKPPQFADWEPMIVGGKSYLVHPAAKQIFDWGLGIDRTSILGMLGFDPHGKTAMVAQSLGTAWMALRNATIPVKLAISGFHAQHMLGIQAFQPFAAALEQALNKHLTFGEFLKSVKEGSSVYGAHEHGRRVAESWAKEYIENPVERAEQNLMIIGGFSPQQPSFYQLRTEQTWRRLFNDTLPSIRQSLTKENAGTLARMWGVTPSYAEGAMLAIGHVIENIQHPLFGEWIPALKTTAYLNQAKLHISTHPELLRGTPESNSALRMAMREIASSIDSRFGEVQYDKVFMPKLLRQALGGTLLSVGWNLGFMREFIGGPYERGGVLEATKLIGRKIGGKPSLKDEISTRIVYAGTYTAGALIMGGLATWMLSGKFPDDFRDLVYPLLPDGTRLTTPFFTREFGALWYNVQSQGLGLGIADWATAKMAPLVEGFKEAMQGYDYYGHEIYDPNAGFFTQSEQRLAHMMGVTALPISVQAMVDKRIDNPAQAALAIGGYSPAPKYVQRPHFQSQILAAYGRLHPQSVIPFAEEDRLAEFVNAKQQFKKWQLTKSTADQKAFDDALTLYIKKYPDHVGRGGATIKQAIRSWMAPDYAMLFRELDQATQEHLLKNATPEDRKTYLRFAHPALRAKWQKRVTQEGPSPAATSLWRLLQIPGRIIQ